MSRTGILSLNQLKNNLLSSDEIIILSTLEDIERHSPTNQIKELLEEIIKDSIDPIIKFQIKKTLSIVNLKLSQKNISILSDHIETLIVKQGSLEALAIAISLLERSEAVIAIDVLRNHNWQNFPEMIIPTFCRFFKKFGSQRDAPQLIELTRSINPIIILVALDALEIIEPSSLPEIIKPLLHSKIPKIKAQAFRALYRFKPSDSINALKTMLFSDNLEQKEIALFHCKSINFSEIEDILLEFVSKCNNPLLLGKVTQIFQNNANIELPAKLYKISLNLDGTHKNLIKGMLLGVIRALNEKGVIKCSIQEYLDQIKQNSLIATAPSQSEGFTNLNTQTNVTNIEQKNSENETINLFSLPDLNIITKEITKDIIKEYESLDLNNKIRYLRKMDFDGYKVFRSVLPQLVRKTKDKELAAIIKLIGRFGKTDDSGLIRDFIHSKNPTEACAAIEALAKIDPEFLIVYLPQLMQSKIGKIRLVSTRIFSKIDQNQAVSLVKSLLLSSSVKQRVLGISLSILIDFSTIKNALLLAFYKETNTDLIDKLSLILSSNPDLDIMVHVYNAYIKSNDVIKESKLSALYLIIDKYMCINKETKSKEEILNDIVHYYNINKSKIDNVILHLGNNNLALSQVLSSSNTNLSLNDPKTNADLHRPPQGSLANEASQNAIKATIYTTIQEDTPNLNKNHIIRYSNSILKNIYSKINIFFFATDYEIKSFRAKVALVIWLLVIILWGFMIACIGTDYLFGGN